MIAGDTGFQVWLDPFHAGDEWFAFFFQLRGSFGKANIFLSGNENDQTGILVCLPDCYPIDNGYRAAKNH